MFVMYGPNTNLGGSSIIRMLESQAGAWAAAPPPLPVGEAGRDPAPRQMAMRCTPRAAPSSCSS